MTIELNLIDRVDYNAIYQLTQKKISRNLDPESYCSILKFLNKISSYPASKINLDGNVS